MGFAGAGAADQDQVSLMQKEVAAGEIPDERFVDRGSLEGKLVDFLGQRQLGDRHLVFDRARLLLVDLGLQVSTAEQNPATWRRKSRPPLVCG
jgi:hypothetical protein